MSFVSFLWHRFITVIKHYWYDVSLSMLWKVIVVMKVYDCNETSSIWQTLRNCDENSIQGEHFDKCDES